MNEIVITKDNFDEEVRNYKGMPILLDFWASWCGPCMMLAPIVEEVADVDEQPELAAAFKVESIPMLVVVKDGGIVNQAVGYRSKADVIKMLGL